MKAGLIIAGILIAALGVWIALGKFLYNDTQTKASFGPIKVQATEQKSVPAALGYVAIVLGAGLVVAGAVKKT